MKINEIDPGQDDIRMIVRVKNVLILGVINAIGSRKD